MPSLLTQKQLRAVQNFDFCYLCGRRFVAGDLINRDHVPPTALFAEADRSPPLILATHEVCNSAQTDYDEQIGQLISVMHRAPVDSNISKLNLEVRRVAESTVPAVLLIDFPLRRIVTRWLKGMHAALYGDPMPSTARCMFFGPLPEGQTKESFDYVHLFHPQLVATIKKNREAKRTDLIICRNGKFKYECVWTKRPDDGLDCCVFAIDVYDWSQLGDVHHAPKRSCVGFYIPSCPRPASASFETKIEFEFPNAEPLDAFGG